MLWWYNPTGSSAPSTFHPSPCDQHHAWRSFHQTNFVLDLDLSPSTVNMQKIRYCHKNVRWTCVLYVRFLFWDVYVSKKYMLQDMFFNVNICLKTSLQYHWTSLFGPVLLLLIYKRGNGASYPQEASAPKHPHLRSHPPRDNATSFDHLHIHRSWWLNHGLKFPWNIPSKFMANLVVNLF